MTTDPFKILGVMLPSLCLLYSVSWSAFSLAPLRHESFGSPDYYLDLRLDGIPKRSIAGKDVPEAVNFRGVLASQDREDPIIGKRVRVHGQTWYFFESSAGKFRGWLQKGTKGCEPELHFRLEKNAKAIESGVLRAGFCPPS